MGRLCLSCRVLKPLSAFDPIDKTGILQVKCRECITKLWKEKIEHKVQSLEEIRRANPAAYDRLVLSTLYTNANRRAKKLGIDFTIQRSDIPLQHICPVFGCALVLNSGKQTNSSYSLDRIDSNLGYIPGNIRVISWRANYLKGNLTLDEAENLMLYMKGLI